MASTCKYSTGNGSVVVGSVDGKIRLTSKISMRMAKTVLPELGSPITHVDVTYDGHILGIDLHRLYGQGGKDNTGFSGLTGNRIAAPSLLKLIPLASILARNDKEFHGGQLSRVSVRLLGNQCCQKSVNILVFNICTLF
jgi:hypothetical protein